MEEQQSLGSLKKMLKTKGENGGGSQIIATVIDDLGDDLMQNVLGRLPALSFASAACVSRSWNSLCHRIISAPKLCSAVSLNPILENAVNEVVDKVLQEPIRPHFVMASIFHPFNLQAAFQLIEGKFGSGIPVIVNVCEEVIGRDVATDQFVEVQWETIEEVDHDTEYKGTVKGGISLTVGFLPGLKAHIIPLLLNKRAQEILTNDFVMDIREVATAVSNSTSPAGIIMFSGQTIDITPVLRTLDIGETQFHVMLSTGISPISSTYKAVSVKCWKHSTWLTASRETVHGQAIVEEVYDEVPVIRTQLAHCCYFVYQLRNY